MGHYIENATTRRARVLVYAGTEMISVTDLTGSGLLPCKYVMHSPTSAVRDFVSKRAAYRKGVRNV